MRERDKPDMERGREEGMMGCREKEERKGRLSIKRGKDG